MLHLSQCITRLLSDVKSNLPSCYTGALGDAPLNDFCPPLNVLKKSLAKQLKQ